jgi:hypothetical protein
MLTFATTNTSSPGDTTTDVYVSPVPSKCCHDPPRKDAPMATTSPGAPKRGAGGSHVSGAGAAGAVAAGVAG